MDFKDSNIDWISEIPVNWNIRKLKYILNERIEKNNPIKTNNVLSLTAVQGVVPYSEKKSSGGNKQKEDLSSYKLAYPNDIVLNSMNIVTGSVGLSNYYGCVSPVYYMFYSDNKNINVKYYNYIFKSKIFQRRLIGFGNGILQMTSEAGNLYAVRMKIPIDKFKSLMFPVPPIVDQNAIVEYLDIKTDWIDRIIKKYERLIILLEEKRVALINQVVTKGLNPNVSMKDSGVEWIGEIPKHWDITRLKFLISKNAQYGANCEPEPDSNKFDYRYVRITDIDDDATLKENIVYLSAENAKGFVLNEGDVLFARSGATVGKTYLYNKHDGACCYAGYLIRYVPNKELLNPKYLLYFSFSKSYVEWIKIVSTQATIQNVSADKYDNLIISLPNIEEQNKIVSFLDNKISNIDSSISKINENIELLEEYKASLIHHVVTGKIDVRGEKI